MNIVHNARITLLANLFNAMAGTSFTVGVAAPLAAKLFYNSAGLSIDLLAVGLAIWTGLTVTMHVGAYQILGRLRS